MEHLPITVLETNSITDERELQLAQVGSKYIILVVPMYDPPLTLQSFSSLLTAKKNYRDALRRLTSRLES